MQTWVDLKFAEGEYPFSLGLDQIRLLESDCNAGLGAIYARTLQGRFGNGELDADPLQAAYRFMELVAIIRMALVGGGTDSTRANMLIAAYVTGQTDTRMAVARTWALAASILSALIEGYAPPKKD